MMPGQYLLYRPRKVVDAPVLHVNGDDAEAVSFVSKLAVEYRLKLAGYLYRFIVLP
jgi:2-oxoglutarate dehydrogenase E1 component